MYEKGVLVTNMKTKTFNSEKNFLLLTTGTHRKVYAVECGKLGKSKCLKKIFTFLNAGAINCAINAHSTAIDAEKKIFSAFLLRLIPSARQYL
jgi:NADPH:quinone reductase-like Zn-dependent oxidoreductase